MFQAETLQFYSGSVEAHNGLLGPGFYMSMFRISLNLLSCTGSISRLDEENRPKRSVHWKKMKNWMNNR